MNNNKNTVDKATYFEGLFSITFKLKKSFHETHSFNNATQPIDGLFERDSWAFGLPRRRPVASSGRRASHLINDQYPPIPKSKYK
jgi:hypothetical protein